MKKIKTTSAGGVVARRANNRVEVLLLNDENYDDWMLPKGHVEGEETLEETALREIEEEVGATNCRVIAKLGVCKRHKEETNEDKTIHFFLVVAPTGEPTGKTEFSYMKTKWFPIDDLPKIYLPEEENIIMENVDRIKENIDI